MTLTGANEVKDVEAVCEWTHQKLNQDLVVLGSSAGAPIAGSAVESFSFIKAYVGIGYVFGWWASIIFGSHYKKIMKSEKPKLFIMGTKDEFTSTSKLEWIFKRMTDPKEMKLIQGVGHFELEGSEYDGQMAELTAEFVNKHFKV
eukprot:CAMPEP_0184326888 /NCGR_PEP_ID=MMETSP1049-20130417/142805_1 /TAXON_ID=77928 /ORGANISM="Proteomonas sulcata, Strain CCMP704" /LENGTH=144 /DNA_ID=CAMNT_0026649115 /DNA_START=356 /DNA_END=790 /DNA_ORIENTATION=+